MKPGWLVRCGLLVGLLMGWMVVGAQAGETRKEPAKKEPVKKTEPRKETPKKEAPKKEEPKKKEPKKKEEPKRKEAPKKEESRKVDRVMIHGRVMFKSRDGGMEGAGAVRVVARWSDKEGKVCRESDMTDRDVKDRGGFEIGVPKGAAESVEVFVDLEKLPERFTVGNRKVVVALSSAKEGRIEIAEPFEVSLKEPAGVRK